VRSEGGQAAVELVALLPLLAVVVLALMQGLAAGTAAELADHAAEAGAVALLQGRDPQRAARDALPGWPGRDVHVAVQGRQVRVRVRPRGPIRALTTRLQAAAQADAGPPGP